jgi:hypothetical protein
MQKNQFFQKKILFLLSSVLFVFALLSISSCNNKEKGKPPKAAGSKMNCVILTQAQVQGWDDKDPAHANNKSWVKKILLQFYSADGSNASNNMQLVAYPGKDMTDAGSYGGNILSIDTTCVALPLNGPTIFANNWIDADSLKIIKPNGDLEDFDFVRFRPTYEFPPFINFAIEIVRTGKGKPNTLLSYGTSPCPPCQYCRPPNCPPTADSTLHIY